MGILSDYFVASKAELSTIAEDRALPESLKRIDAKGFGFMALDVWATMLEVEGKALEPGEPVVSGDDFEWFVQRLRKESVTAIATVTDADLKKHVKALSKNELVEVGPTLGALLAELRVLAQSAIASKRDMYLWTST